MKFIFAREVLRDAAFKLGGELFTYEALKKLGKIQAEEDNTIKDEMQMAEFVEHLFDIKSEHEKKYSEFWELLRAIHTLAKLESD